MRLLRRALALLGAAFVVLLALAALVGLGLVRLTRDRLWIDETDEAGA